MRAPTACGERTVAKRNKIQLVGEDALLPWLLNTELFSLGLVVFWIFFLIMQLGCPGCLRGENRYRLSRHCEVAHVGTGTKTMSVPPLCAV